MEKGGDNTPRPTPDEILARVMRQETKSGRGRHKIFIGFAAGVGKTYEMLSEANRRKQRGQDVVIGFVETYGRKGTEGQIGDLEIIPRKVIEYRGATFEEMDVDAILTRHPEMALVDELAHTNVPGSTREKRWQDVELLLDAGINVLSTMNVQHLESLNDVIHDITGVWVRETVPDRIIREANEYKMVDITPRALLHRLERGDIYPSDKIGQALQNWFREGNLNALREIALREIAHEVDEDLADYRREHRIDKPWAVHDKIMVCVSPNRSSLRLIRRGWRIAQRLQGDIVAVYVMNQSLSKNEAAICQDNLELAQRLNVPVVTLKGNVADELIRYSRENDITQIVIGHSTRSRWQELIHGSVINRLMRALRMIDILVVSTPHEPADR
ncbi:MAG: universal stress protein [Armatimonadetes bacterium]|nr:universal stress protein [Armatimonadota bacterium]